MSTGTGEAHGSAVVWAPCDECMAVISEAFGDRVVRMAALVSRAPNLPAVDAVLAAVIIYGELGSAVEEIFGPGTGPVGCCGDLRLTYDSPWTLEQKVAACAAALTDDEIGVYASDPQPAGPE